jgi:hypothetical protein
MSKQFSAVGSAKTYFSFLDSTGYALGSGLTLANGSSSGASQILGFNSIGIPVPPARTVVVTGDNTALGSVLIPGNTAAQGTLVTSVRNPTLSNKAIGLLAETIGNTDFEGFGTPCPVFTPMMVIDSAPGFDSNGNAGYETIIWFNVQLMPIEEATIADSAVHQFTHNVKANPVTVRPWGKSLTVSTNGSTKLLGQKLFNTYPLLAATYIGDGAATTTVLDQAPVAADGNSVIVYQDGVLLVYGAGAGKYTLSGSTITFGTAPTAGAKVEILYFYAPTC